MSKLVMVDVLSSFRMRYVVQVQDDVRDALDEVVWSKGSPDFKEFSQKHIDPTAILDYREITEEEYLKLFYGQKFREFTLDKTNMILMKKK